MRLPEWQRSYSCLEWWDQHATEPVTRDTGVCDFHSAVFIWNHTQVCLPSSHHFFPQLHLVQNIFALLCFPKIFPLPLSLPLTSPPPPHTRLFLEKFLSVSFFLPFFSLFSPHLVLCPFNFPPPQPSHRYLTPRLKTEFYDVTKWVEDVNRNTQGPYLRYYLGPRPVYPTRLSKNSLTFWFDLWFGKEGLVPIWSFFSFLETIQSYISENGMLQLRKGCHCA